MASTQANKTIPRLLKTEDSVISYQDLVESAKSVVLVLWCGTPIVDAAISDICPYLLPLHPAGAAKAAYTALHTHFPWRNQWFKKNLAGDYWLDKKTLSCCTTSVYKCDHETLDCIDNLLFSSSFSLCITYIFKFYFYEMSYRCLWAWEKKVKHQFDD